MSEMRWTGSDHALMEAADIEALAVEVACEIRDGQYDGYKARNRQLAAMIAFNLAQMVREHRWCVQADEEEDVEGLRYHVWVER